MTGNYFIISVQITSWIIKQPLVIPFEHFSLLKTINTTTAQNATKAFLTKNAIVHQSCSYSDFKSLPQLT